MGVDDVQAIGSDRARRAQNGNLLHSRPLRCIETSNGVSRYGKPRGAGLRVILGGPGKARKVRCRALADSPRLTSMSVRPKVGWTRLCPPSEKRAGRQFPSRLTARASMSDPNTSVFQASARRLPAKSRSGPSPRTTDRRRRPTSCCGSIVGLLALVCVYLFMNEQHKGDDAHARGV